MSEKVVRRLPNGEILEWMRYTPEEITTFWALEKSKVPDGRLSHPATGYVVISEWVETQEQAIELHAYMIRRFNPDPYLCRGVRAHSRAENAGGWGWLRCMVPSEQIEHFSNLVSTFHKTGIDQAGALFAQPGFFD